MFVIIGGGIGGLSVAYHLALKTGGSKRIVLLERDVLTCGTTWHAAGLVGCLAGSKGVAKYRAYGQQVYDQLSREVRDTGFKRNGGIAIATNPDRFEIIKKWHRVASAAGVDCRMISKEEVKELAPLIRVDDVLGGLWSPLDGQINPVDAAMALASKCRSLGVEIREKTPVEELLLSSSSSGRVIGVKTGGGEQLACESAVLCGGMWSRELVRSLGNQGVFIPLWPCEHEYFLTESIKDCRNHPVVRSYDESLYIKEDAGKLLVGLFEPNAKPAFREGKIPQDFSFGSFPDDMDHLEPYIVNAMHRVPVLEEKGLSKFFAGPESFTPDGREMIGEVPGVRGLYTCTGFNSHGIVCGPAIGRDLVEKMVSDKSPSWANDIRRFQPWQNDDTFLQLRAAESLGRQYHQTYPFEESKHGQDRMQRSPFHDLLVKRRAHFGQSSVGNEIPLYFNADLQEDEAVLSWAAKQNWFANVQTEQDSVKNDCAWFDFSDYTKLMCRFKGTDIFDPARFDVLPTGKSEDEYYLVHRKHGTVEAAFSILRGLENEQDLLLAEGFVRMKLLDALREDAQVEDVTYSLPMVGIYGPNARIITGSLIVEHEQFPGMPGFMVLDPNIEELAQFQPCGFRARENLEMESGIPKLHRDFATLEDLANIRSFELQTAPTFAVTSGEIVYDDQHKPVGEITAATFSSKRWIVMAQLNQADPQFPLYIVNQDTKLKLVNRYNKKR